ncbi:MAG: MarR family winged helix-turn-helix transcriptional regulator [Caulobacteraceae bacterium]
MSTWQPDLAPLIDRIPRLYFLLRAVGEALHADLAVTPSMRGLMRSLEAGPRTVPDLARERPVSRQHAQQVANALFAEGLAEPLANPAHRRSPRLALTDEGRRRLRVMDERESALMAQIAPGVSPVELAAALQLFDLLERELALRAADAQAA